MSFKNFSRSAAFAGGWPLNFPMGKRASAILFSLVLSMTKR